MAICAPGSGALDPPVTVPVIDPPEVWAGSVRAVIRVNSRLKARNSRGPPIIFETSFAHNLLVWPVHLRHVESKCRTSSPISSRHKPTAVLSDCLKPRILNFPYSCGLKAQICDCCPTSAGMRRYSLSRRLFHAIPARHKTTLARVPIPALARRRTSSSQRKCRCAHLSSRGYWKSTNSGPGHSVGSR